ncbi:hypothetical protein BGX28_000550 [Mortierella sp. GBA30]|nr:hypothetical protein BGX28_000550 [Mortierella sp. GBA30]
MKLNRRSFVGILYDVILFEYASQVRCIEQQYTLSLDDLADAFAFVADFYKHNRQLMDIPCDQFITRNQLHTVVGLVDYIEEMDRGVFEIFPRNVELREEAPSFASSSSTKRDRRRQERQERLSSHGGASRNKNKVRGGLDDLFDVGGRNWTADLYSYRRGQDTDTDLDDEYSIIIPGLSKNDIQTFLWEYAYMPEEYQDDIATLIRYLRRDEWMMDGSKGSIVKFDWGLEGVQKFSKEYNQSKIHKIKLREQEEVKKAQEVTQRQQEAWNRQQELIREREAARRIKNTDDFIWKMHKVSSLAITSDASAEIDTLIKTLEIEISEYLDYCFVALTAVGSFASGLHTHQNDLDLTLTGNIKHINHTTLADALRHYNYESISVVSSSAQRQQQQQQPSTSTPPLPPSFVTFLDPRSGIHCHLTINDPISIYRSKLVYTYTLIEPRFSPVMVALKHLAAQRHLLSTSVHEDGHSFMPLGSYALALMLITFLQTENPPLLPKLQQTSLDDDRPSPKEVIVQGIDCSFDRDWKLYQGFGSTNIKSVAELLIDFCRFFGYVFDYESKEVNARIGAFRWRPGLTKGMSTAQIATTTSSGSSSGAFSSSNSGNGSVVEISRIDKIEGDVATFHVMDPFIIGLNVTSTCQGELVRMVKECFQEAYEALSEGDINLAFSDSYE